jgi:hypothetical protein
VPVSRSERNYNSLTPWMQIRAALR